MSLREDGVGMIFPGLVSVTFRQFSPRDVLSLAVGAGLRGIMWGGDVHAPPGKIEQAREIARMTVDDGLEVEGLGSYYRAGALKSDGLFEQNLDIAIALRAPRIRVWAGEKNSELASEAERAAVVADLRRCAELAHQVGVRIVLEFHGDTLTNTAESAATLMRELSDTDVRLYWQPPNGSTREDALAGLRLVLPWVDSIHVFQWDLEADGNLLRRSLAEGASAWSEYLAAVNVPDVSRWAMLEFVKGDDPRQFLEDARQLQSWILDSLTV